MLEHQSRGIHLTELCWWMNTQNVATGAQHRRLINSAPEMHISTKLTENFLSKFNKVVDIFFLSEATFALKPKRMHKMMEGNHRGDIFFYESFAILLIELKCLGIENSFFWFNLGPFDREALSVAPKLLEQGNIFKCSIPPI